MTIGGFDDIILRFNDYLVGWFGDSPSVVDSIIEGYAEVWAWFYIQYVYLRKQTRIKTATDVYLDLISSDFFGTELPRKNNESDGNFRIRILLNLFREKATREGMRKVLFDLTGFEPIIIEPYRPQDTGAYNVASTMGYNIAGRYSGAGLQYQAFIIVFRPILNGVGRFAGLNVTNHGYNVVQSPTEVNPVLNAYGSISLIESFVTDADIYHAVAITRMNSTRIWVKIVDKEIYQA